MVAQAPPLRSSGKRHRTGRMPESDLRAVILVRRKKKAFTISLFLAGGLFISVTTVTIAVFSPLELSPGAIGTLGWYSGLFRLQETGSK